MTTAYAPGTNLLLFGMEENAYLGFDRWWAENGLVCIENRVTGEYDSFPPEKAEHRLAVLAEMLKRGLAKDADERRRIQRYIDTMESVIIPKAKAQGSPRDPTCYASRVAALPKQFVVPASAAIAHPTLDAPPLKRLPAPRGKRLAEPKTASPKPKKKTPAAGKEAKRNARSK